MAVLHATFILRPRLTEQPLFGDTASHHATVKREQGKAHTGFQSFFLEMTHGTSALTSLTKENPVYGHLLVQQGWDI